VEVNMILVSSALGIIGRELIKILADQGQRVRGLVPGKGGASHLDEWLDENLDDPSKAENVEFAFGDFDDRPSLDAAMAGVDAAIILMPSIMDDGVRMEDLYANLLSAAVGADVQNIVNVSGSAAALTPPTQIGASLALCEQLVEASGIDSVHIRFPLFMLMQNIRVHAGTIRTTGQFFYPFGGKRMAMVDARDIAEVAARLLVSNAHAGKTYTITGPEALDGDDVAAVIAEIIGKPTQCVPVPAQIARAALVAMKMPEWIVDDLLTLYGENGDEAGAQVWPTVQQITHHPPRTLADYVRYEAWAFTEEDGQLSGWDE
jgi:uncharacterized protein YbjT (DUF2867 family)